MKSERNPLLISQPSVIFNIFCPKGAIFFHRIEGMAATLRNTEWHKVSKLQFSQKSHLKNSL